MLEKKIVKEMKNKPFCLRLLVLLRLSSDSTGEEALEMVGVLG